MEIESPRREPWSPQPRRGSAVESTTNYRVTWSYHHRGSSSRRGGWKLVAWSWAAFFIDAVASGAATLLLLAGVMRAFHWSLPFEQEILFTGAGEGFLVSFALILSLHLNLARVFLGFTLGEWACGLRLGEPHQRLAADYVFRVHLRFFLCLVTGVVTLPLISLLIREDLVGRWSGLPLVMARR